MILQSDYMDMYNQYYAATVWGAMFWWILMIVIWLIIGLVCAIFVYRDAKQTKGVNAIGWAIVSFLLAFIGVLIYLLLKNSKK